MSESFNKPSERSSLPLAAEKARAVDLMDAPLLGRLFRWRHARTALQIPPLIISVLMVLHGFFGPTLAPKNLATTVSWVHFRGALVFVLLLAGNFFCLACPFMLPRQLARKHKRTGKAEEITCEEQNKHEGAPEVDPTQGGREIFRSETRPEESMQNHQNADDQRRDL